MYHTKDNPARVFLQTLNVIQKQCLASTELLQWSAGVIKSWLSRFLICSLFSFFLSGWSCSPFTLIRGDIPAHNTHIQHFFSTTVNMPLLSAVFPLVRPSSLTLSAHPALQGAGGARELGSVPAVTGPVAGFALNKLPVGRAVSLGAIKIVKLFPYPLSHSGAALLLPLVWRARVRRPGRQRVLVCRVPGHPGESVVVHRQVSLPGGLPAQQDRHRDPASRRPAEEQRQKNQNKVKTEITVMNQQQSHFLTSRWCWQSSRWNRCGALLFKAAYYVKVQRRFIYVTMEQSTI